MGVKYVQIKAGFNPETFEGLFFGNRLSIDDYPGFVALENIVYKPEHLPVTLINHMRQLLYKVKPDGTPGTFPHTITDMSRLKLRTSMLILEDKNRLYKRRGWMDFYGMGFTENSFIESPFGDPEDIQVISPTRIRCLFDFTEHDGVEMGFKLIDGHLPVVDGYYTYLR